MMVSSPSSERDKKNKNESIESSTRERMQIIADILNHCTVYKTKNYIMENAHLNIEQVNSCLCNLLYREFVQVGVSSSQGSLIYKTTEKGRGLLEYYYHMMQEFLEYNNLVMGQIREDYVDIQEKQAGGEQNISYYNNTNHIVWLVRSFFD